MRFGLCGGTAFWWWYRRKLMKNGGDGNDKTWKFAQNVVTLMDGKFFWCLIMSCVRETFASAFLDTIHSLLHLIEFPYPFFVFCCCCYCCQPASHPSTITKQTYTRICFICLLAPLSSYQFVISDVCHSISFLLFDDIFSP